MKRVFVGMSGGVDSSVAALRLIKDGYDVVGVFIKVWQPDFIDCNWEKERLDAMRVAAHLNIPFFTMDAEEAYKTRVADYMVAAYREGLTPNPDVMCNEYVKFGAFYEWARAHGAAYIATGHYARREGESLLRARDEKKDQSYFLSRIHEEVLSRVLFPIGDSLKEDVRKEAEAAKIPTAAKADSQGICFLGQIDIKTFLEHYISLKKGEVHNTAGEVIGTHNGAILYTLGQRQGFLIHGEGIKPSPHYVIDRNIEKNIITVDTVPPSAAIGESILLKSMNVLGSGLTDSMDAVFRYHGPSIPVTVKRQEDGSVILHTLNAAVQTPARGQMCVLYRGDECCGGGIIS